MNEATGTAEEATTQAALEGVDTTIDPAQLERLNPRVQLLWLLRVAVYAIILGGISAGIGWFVDLNPAIVGGGIGAFVVIVGVPHTILLYRTWGFTIRDDSLYLQRGVLVRVQTVVPYVRIQHVDTSRAPLERLLTLASSMVYTAGTRGADVRIPGLEPDRARALQERLKDLANVTGEDDAV